MPSCALTCPGRNSRVARESLVGEPRAPSRLNTRRGESRRDTSVKAQGPTARAAWPGVGPGPRTPRHTSLRPMDAWLPGAAAALAMVALLLWLRARNAGSLWALGGRRVLICGASTGIGREAALQAAAVGAFHRRCRHAVHRHPEDPAPVLARWHGHGPRCDRLGPNRLSWTVRSPQGDQTKVASWGLDYKEH